MLEGQFQQLVTAVTEYDIRNATRAGYWRDGLPDYLGRLAEIRTDIDHGRPLRAALIMGFRGRLQTVLLAAVGEPHATDAERRGVYAYKPMGVN